MSKERTIRAAAIFLAMILAFGNTSSVMAAEAGEASTEEIVITEETPESPMIESPDSMEAEESEEDSNTAVMESEDNCDAVDDHFSEDNSSQDEDDASEKLIEETSDHKNMEDKTENQEQTTEEVFENEATQKADWEPYIENVEYALTVGNAVEIRVFFKTDSQMSASADSIPEMSCRIEGLDDAQLECPDVVKTDGDGRYYRFVTVTSEEQGTGSLIITVQNSKLTTSLTVSAEGSNKSVSENDYSAEEMEQGTDGRKSEDSEADIPSKALEKKDLMASEEKVEDTISSLGASTAISAAQKAIDDARKVIAEGSFGFFKAVGADDCVDILENAREAAYTVKGDPDDATSLENMKTAIELIAEGNELRIKEGRRTNALMVTDILMAYAQSNANWGDQHVADHSRQFYCGENAAWGPKSWDPYEGWYYEEKENAEKILQIKNDGDPSNDWEARNYDIGHYRALCLGSNTLTGLAKCTRGSDYGASFSQTFNDSLQKYGQPFTQEDYYARFMAYYNKVYNDLDVAMDALRKDQTISFSNLSSTKVTKTIGDAPFKLGAKASGGTALSYESSNKSVATVDKTGKVTILKAGKATITVTAAKTDDYREAVKTVTLTVNKKTQTISLASTKITKTIGDKAFNLGAKANGTLSYSSSDPTVATVTKEGKVTLLKAGSAVITVKAAATDTYSAATEKVTITVNKKTQILTVPDAGIIKSNAGSIEFDGAAFKLNAKTSGNGKITYKSSDTTVATVGSSTGLVTPKKVGKVEITVTAAETADYKKASLKVTITVTKKKQAITAKDVIKNYGSKAFTLSCTVLDSAPLTFTSSNKDVVTVGKTTGKVTIKFWGEAIITIKATETEKYQSATKKIKVTVLKHGWITDNGKKGYFVKGVPSVGMVTISGNTYGFDQEGYLLYGLQKIGGDTFYMDENGIVSTGWQAVDGRNYYFSPEASEGHLRGAAVTGWNTIDGATFYMDANGRAASGFKNIDGAQYYFNPSSRCEMATGWNTINGFSYYMGTNGVIRTGFKNIDGSQYYFWPETANGHYKGTMAKNWQTLNGFKYYMGSNGVISTGFRTISGKKYYFWPVTANGHYKGTMSTGWPAIDGQKYYAGTNGVIRTGWQTLNGFKYYMGSDGAIRTGFKNIDGSQYYFWPETANGKYRGTMATKWNTINGFRYYMGSDGAIRTGWQTIDGKRYYFWPDTANGHYKSTLKK